MKHILAFWVPDGVTFKQWTRDLYHEINDDGVFNGAAALAYYLLLAIFPAMIFLLSLIPYLPVADVHEAVMEFMRQALPGQAANAFEGVIAEVTLNRRGGLLSVGAVLTLWAASAGLYAIMQQLNITYDVKEARPFWKARLTAIFLTLLFAVMVVGGFALIVFGGQLQDWLSTSVGLGSVALGFSEAFRWIVIALLLLGGFALTYYFGPDVEQRFRFVTPGSLLGAVILVLASVAFRVYVENFGNYAATYGSIGAIISLMLWLYIAGVVLLLGSEVNALIEHYSVDGKDKGEKRQPHPRRRWLSRQRFARAFHEGAVSEMPPSRDPLAPVTPGKESKHLGDLTPESRVALTTPAGVRISHARRMAAARERAQEQTRARVDFALGALVTAVLYSVALMFRRRSSKRALRGI